VGGHGEPEDRAEHDQEDGGPESHRFVLSVARRATSEFPGSVADIAAAQVGGAAADT
jgi:hypothetical protein